MRRGVASAKSLSSPQRQVRSVGLSALRSIPLYHSQGICFIRSKPCNNAIMPPHPWDLWVQCPPWVFLSPSRVFLNPAGWLSHSPWGSRIPSRDSRTPAGGIKPITPSEGVALYTIVTTWLSQTDWIDCSKKLG